MTKEFGIYGSIVDTEIDKCSPEDVCVQDFKSFTGSLTAEDKEVVIDINSCGGSVPAGISMANMIKQLSKNGVKTVARVEGYACSIASVIACACDELQMGVFSFLMIHNAWSVVQGNSNDLRKEADVMDQMNEAILSFYTSKFDLTHDELKAMMDAETWISPADVDTFKLKCTVLDDCTEFKVAAKYVKQFENFNKLPTLVQKALSMKNETQTEEEKKTEEVEKTEEVKKTDDTCEKKAECGEGEEEKTKKEEETKKDEDTPAEKTEEKKEEEKKEEEKQPTVDELQAVIAELNKKIESLEKEKSAPTDERVAGMQSTMQNKINALTKDFKDQLEVMKKELAGYKDQSISLKAELDKATIELQKSASALMEKEQALATLNASVNTPKEEEKVDYKKLHGKAFFDWLKQNNIR